MTWWDHTGTEEWASYEFPQPATVSAAAVYWFDDEKAEVPGACRVPAEWRIVWKDGNDWRPVSLRAGSTYEVALNQFNHIHFEPVTTSTLKLEVKLRTGFAGGILEWQVSGP
jgi:hypothetical protein